MTKPSIMIVEDKFIVAQDIASSLEKLGYEVCTILAAGEDVLTSVKELEPELILMDIRLKGELDGVETAALLKKETGRSVIFLTAHSDSDTVKRASETSPLGYLIKPYDERQLFSTIELALNRKRDFQKTASQNTKNLTKVEKNESLTFPGIIGSSNVMKELLKSIKLVAETDVSVLICGENGTGKELIADAIHKLSSRASKSFIKINCSAIPSTLLESALFGHAKGAFTGANKEQEGFIERAEGGSLFLDEIGDVSHEIQIKLLRLLQSQEYHRVGETQVRKANVRIITATNRDFKELLETGKIREDFYYRINVFPLISPPLRVRGHDIIEIAEFFREQFNPIFHKKITGFSEEVKNALSNYSWPGNVRQLENAIKRAFVLAQGTIILPEHLPAEISEANRIDDSKENLDEKSKILEVLKSTGGNKGKAALLLGYSRITLWKKLHKLGLATSDEKTPEGRKVECA